MSQFESRLLVEGVRAIEGASPNQPTQFIKSKNKSFEALLFERAEELDITLQLTPLFKHFQKLTKNLYSLFAFLLFILGGLAVKKMLFTEQLTSVNFFWAFALFFIPNLLMFCAWIALFLKPSVLENSSLSKFSLSLLKLFERKFNKQQLKRPGYWSLFSCYFELHFSKNLGRYQLSKLTHLLWLSYFTGATLMSVVMLATHQVDFVWQTSILSSDSFQSLTQLLAYFPQQIGFTVPNIEQIQQSHVGTENLFDPESRRLAWSSLLISSLLLYGIIPRLILLVAMSYQSKRAMKKYSLDLSLPYYVQLRQRLKPNKTTLGIQDADDEDNFITEANDSHYQHRHREHLPRDYYPAAIELSSQQLSLAQLHLQDNDPDAVINIINACEHSTQQLLLSEIGQTSCNEIALYVALRRVPDRGLKRFVSQLISLTDKPLYLFLIVENSTATQRDNDWYQFADSVGIELDNIVHIEVKGDNNE
ncbi:membrane protein [Psychromonas marina]|uniref:Membrane protein n=1 Tax=Psychromonas marina TaxID=88364 RepID=A0ABQ6DZF9_9GAMM|nr:DUF2868 domain-containing protein [Psychromonas marina]GLS90544.1 membrane protein [Psychromonas marina]